MRAAGIQRPLEVIFDKAAHSPFVPLGVDVPALNAERLFAYRSVSGLREGVNIVGGTVIGEVFENELMRNHKIMVSGGHHRRHHHDGDEVEGVVDRCAGNACGLLSLLHLTRYTCLFNACYV